MQALFEEALSLPAEQRDAYLQQEAGNSTMVQEVRELLDAHFSAASLWQSDPEDAGIYATDGSHTLLFNAGHGIGSYKVEEKIGVGGMGVIYRALDTRLQRPVALKLLPAYLHRKEMARQRFMLEARAASRLDHPNICAVHDIGETEDGHLYISMPFYEGETLATRVSRGPVPAQKALDISIQVCDGLAKAHAQDIVHRDIKPANIMLTRDGLVKILDFGVVKMANQNLTRAGVRIGTLAYMPPEQMRGDQVDARTDIWAVGTVLFEMLTGRQAFPDGPLQQPHKAAHDEGNETLASLPDEIPYEIRRVLNKAMQQERDARYSNMADMRDALVRARSNRDDRDVTRVRSNRNDRDVTGVRRSPMKPADKSPHYDWDRAFLDTVIDMLLPQLGPVTPKIVHRYARVSPTLNTFIQHLGDVLPDDTACRALTEQIKAKAANRILIRRLQK